LPADTSIAAARTTLAEVGLLFLKLGAISFGGPAAHIALMETETVQKRKWLSREYFMDLLAATNIVPGPNAVEMASHIGFVRAGWPGLFVGGASFILPAALITLAFGWLYVTYGTLPQAQALFYGLNPAILAIILSATYRLGRAAVKNVPLGVLAVACLAASLTLPVDQAFLLLGAGAVSLLLDRAGKINFSPPSLPGGAKTALLLPLVLSLNALQSLLDDGRLVQLGLFFLKVGALLFGSGMVLFAFIQHDIVNRLGWLTQQQLVDAIAVGQMTPGPVLSSATFIGYLVAGTSGALVATAAVFLPSFGIIALLGPWAPRLRRVAAIQSFLKGVNAAVVAAVLSIAIKMALSSIVDGWTAAICLLGLIALLRFKAETWWLVVGGGAVGLFIHWAAVLFG